MVAEPGHLSTGQIARRLLPLYFTHVNQAILTTLPFTLAVYMVRDFESRGGSAPSEATVGRLTGLLAAVFCAAQLVTSYPWGRLSDRIGRKPVLVVGNISCVVSVLGFGLAGSYAQAMAARAVGGALNAIILAEKAILGEGVARPNQAKAFGLLSLCWGLGSLAGPMIGGSLSDPCSTALRVGALCREGSLLVHRPYFLPCLLAGLLSAAATVMTIAGLEETLPSRRRKAGAQPGAGSKAAVYEPVPAFDDAERLPRGGGELELGGLSPPASPTSASLPGKGSEGRQQARGARAAPFRGDSARNMSPGRQSRTATELGAGRHAGRGGASGKYSKLGSNGGYGDSSSGGSRRGSLDSLELGLEVEGGGMHKGEEQQRGGSPLDSPTSLAAGAGAGAAAGGTAGAELAAAGGSLPASAPWYKQRVVLLSLLGYGLIAWLFNILDEVTPIFASAGVAHGGLGFSPSQLAPSLSWGGLVLVVWALQGYPWLSRRLGVVKTLRLGLWHTAPLALLTPCASLFRGAQLPSQALMFVSLSFKAVAGTNAFTSCLILVNAAAPPDALGAVNGAGQSLASLVRAAGPALGGLSWAWSLQLAELRWWPAWLPHQYLPFALVALLALGTDLVYWDFHLPEAEMVDGGSSSSGRGSSSGDADVDGSSRGGGGRDAADQA